MAYKSPKTLRNERKAAALVTAYTMLKRIEQGGSYCPTEWDHYMAKIEHALDLNTIRTRDVA